MLKEWINLELAEIYLVIYMKQVKANSSLAFVASGPCLPKSSSSKWKTTSKEHN